MISPPARPHKKKSAGTGPGSPEAWLPVAVEALRAAHTAHCASLAVKGKPACEDTSRLLARRASLLIQLVEALVTESRCEERLRQVSTVEVLHDMKSAEEQLLGRIKQMLSGSGLKLQVAKLLEQEALMTRASLARVQLALMEIERTTPA